MHTLPTFENGIHWTSAIRPGQYAVFLRDRDTSVPLTADGQFAAHNSVTMFDSLSEARAWGEQACAMHARARCDIYNSEGFGRRCGGIDL